LNNNQVIIWVIISIALEKETRRQKGKKKQNRYFIRIKKIVLSVPRGWNVTPPGSFFLSLSLSESCGSYGKKNL
jgi:hypothetical protein